MTDTQNKSIREQIEQVLNEIRQYIQNDGGDVLFKSFENGILTLEVLGHCVGCASFDITYTYGIRQNLMQTFPEIKDVVFVPKKTVW